MSPQQQQLLLQAHQQQQPTQQQLPFQPQQQQQHLPTQQHQHQLRQQIQVDQPETIPLQVIHKETTDFAENKDNLDAKLLEYIQEGSVTKNIETRGKRDAQFIQQFQTGSNSQHFNCAGPNGCGNIPGIQQVIGGQVQILNTRHLISFVQL